MIDSRVRARLAESRSARAGALVLVALGAFAAFGPLFAHHGPLESDFVRGLSPAKTPVGPSWEFPFGADPLFRDVFVRLAYAGRLSLFVAVASTAIATVVGAVVGVLSGWCEGQGARLPWAVPVTAAAALTALAFGQVGVAAALTIAGAAAAVTWRGRALRVDVDGLLMRLVDVLLAFPFLLLVMTVGAALERTSVVTVLFTLGLTGWLGMARVLRAKTLQVRSLEYVEASRALGQSTPRLLLRHVLPNIAGPLVVSSTVLVAQMIVADSVLGYLGVGISPPRPTWGRMLFEGQDDIVTAPWLVAAPGAAILAAVWAFNMLGEGLRDALDPTAG